MSDYLYRSLVQAELLLGTALLVLLPLGLLAVAWGQPPLRYRLLAYWRASSLLMITVYLMIAEQPLAFLTAVLSLGLVPWVLWRGDGLQRDAPAARFGTTRAARFFRGWRWAVSAFCVLAVVFVLPRLACLLGPPDGRCAYWYDQAWLLHFGLHPNLSVATVKALAFGALGAYALYLGAVARRVAS